MEAQNLFNPKEQREANWPPVALLSRSTCWVTESVGKMWLAVMEMLMGEGHESEWSAKASSLSMGLSNEATLTLNRLLHPFPTSPIIRGFLCVCVCLSVYVWLSEWMRVSAVWVTDEFIGWSGLPFPQQLTPNLGNIHSLWDAVLGDAEP